MDAKSYILIQKEKRVVESERDNAIENASTQAQEAADAAFDKAADEAFKINPALAGKIRAMKNTANKP